LQLMLKYLFLFGMILAGLNVLSQEVNDSIQLTDTVATPLKTIRKPRQVVAAPPMLTDTATIPDVFLPNTRRDTMWAVQPGYNADSAKFIGNPYFKFTNPTRHSISIKQWQGKEAIFYTLIGLLIFFALIKNSFYRYIQDLFKIFFRTSVRQRQIKEQLISSPLPSLLLNIFFLFSVGMFVALVLQDVGLGMQYNFWILFLYCIAALAAIYGGKFIIMKFIGWILQASEASDGYIFIVFTTNKILGIALLPFIIVLAFTNGPITRAALTLGVGTLIGLLVYRYFLSYVTIHRQIRINFLHFIIYLAAFEIAPLLLINKLLLTILG
jgi:hypothetical protein